MYLVDVMRYFMSLSRRNQERVVLVLLAKLDWKPREEWWENNTKLRPILRKR